MKRAVQNWALCPRPELVLACAVLAWGCAEPDRASATTSGSGGGGGGGAGGAETSACPAGFERVAHLETGGKSQELFIAGNVAYVSDIFGLRAIDVSDPEAPVELGFFDGGGENIQFNDLVVQGGVGYVAGGSRGLSTLDLSDPAAPIVLHVTGEPSSAALTVSVVGQRAVLAHGQWGLRTYDLSARDPVALHTYEGAGSICDVVLDGGVAYACDVGMRIDVVDVSTAQANELAHFTDDDPASGQTFQPGSHGMHVDGAVLYFGNGHNLYALDVTAPARPVELFVAQLADGIEDLHLDGQCLYASHTNGGFTAIDVSMATGAPAATAIVNADVRLASFGVWSSSGYVYVLERDGGLHVYRAL